MKYFIKRVLNWIYLRYIQPHDSTIDVGVSIIGRNLKIGSGSVIMFDSILDSSAGQILIGENSRISQKVGLYSWGGEINIGSNVTLNSGVIIYGTGGVAIGNDVLIAANTVLVSSSHNFEERLRSIRLQGFSARGITIKNNVWIGSGVTILDGVTVGEGSIVGAGSVVNKNIPPFSVSAGVPARIIRYR